MSEDTERIRACLSRDWKTTVQILEESGIRCTNRRCGLVKVYNTLDSDRRYGLVEKATVEHVGRNGKAAIWRLAE